MVRRPDLGSAQFPVGGVADWYEEFVGLYPCMQCGDEITEDVARLNSGCCSGRCYGRMVGIYI